MIIFHSYLTSLDFPIPPFLYSILYSPAKNLYDDPGILWDWKIRDTTMDDFQFGHVSMP